MIYLGADHRGFELKEKIKLLLTEMEYDYEDVGAFELDNSDSYPEFASKVSEKIINDEDRGIIICGSGVGVDIVANKYDNIRSGLAINHEQVQQARRDDDINVLTLAADYVSDENLHEILLAFLMTEFSGEPRKVQRINEINKIAQNE